MNQLPPKACFFGMNCTAVACRFSHPPGFVPRTASASAPAKDNKKKLASPSCRECHYGADCKNADCAFTHPPSRPAKCSDGHYCCSKSCPKPHPQNEFDKIFHQKAKLFGPQWSSIDEARRIHKAKILNLIRLAHDKSSNDRNAGFDELIKQLRVFEDVLTKIVNTATKKIPKDILCREIFRLNLALPALALRDEIMSTVSSSQFVIIQVDKCFCFRHFLQ